MQAREREVHVLPDDEFEGWLVKDGGGCILGRFPTREVAELTVESMLRGSAGSLVVRLPDGRCERLTTAGRQAGAAAGRPPAAIIDARQGRRTLSIDTNPGVPRGDQSWLAFGHCTIAFW